MTDKLLNRMKKIVPVILATVLFLGIWHIGSILVDRPFLPTPWESFVEFKNVLVSGEILPHFWISTYRVVISIIIAFILAVPLGLIMGQNEKIDKVFSPLIYILYPLPKVVFLPIIVVIMGLGNSPKVFLISLVIFFQIIVVARDASRSVPYASKQSMRALNANKWQTYRHLIVPYCLPQILTSLRITLGTAIAILFFAETFASVDGLGYFILNGMDARNYEMMYAGIIAMGFLGLMLYFVVDLVEHYFCRWQSK